MFGDTATHRLAAAYSTIGLVLIGWIGIISGRHYAATNLHEPWAQVAEVVAADVHNGATVISANPPFFFYLDYQLGLQWKMHEAEAADLGAELYRRNGYNILDQWIDPQQLTSLHGKIVLVNGSGMIEDVKLLTNLHDALGSSCTNLGEYRAAPDPAYSLKQQFIRDVPALAYRTRVTWYDCP